ncbi:uncharacterized protein LOC129225104 [Uloborus diversus]|uniref:uncharacterized protein LOC129225104 n=1 Tax=Uloborus diversus TaxID=327109 RepID=UPI002409F432|nr:uncharacterized protein LOC129225104 [Uloborus diversus]
MVTLFFSCAFILLNVVFIGNVEMLQEKSKASGVAFWNLPKGNPLMIELHRDPGTLLGKGINVDISRIKQGDFSSLPKSIADMLTPRRERSAMDSNGCTISVQTIKTIPGVCTRLKGKKPACVNNEYVDIDSRDCR